MRDSIIHDLPLNRALILLFCFTIASAAPERETAEQSSPASAEAANKSWTFLVHAQDLSRGLLSIDLSLHGFSGALELCGDMHGAVKSVRELRLADSKALLKASSDDPDCFDAVASPGAPLLVHYQLDLKDLASRHGDPDWATRVGDGYVFNDEAVLLRPDPLPADAAIDISFQLPEGISVAAPWKSVGESGAQFHSDSRQYDAGSYVAIGHLNSLGAIESHGGTFDVVELAGEHKASAAALRNWVARAASAVGDFYGGVPSGRALVILLPVSGASDPGVFGSTLHRAAPSAVLFFGAEADDAAFADDWMATHELFHVGNPRLTTRVHWFNEGSATYYQDVLRARAGMVPAEKIWSDLYDGFHRFCDPEGTGLADDSLHLHEHHRYTHVYWGGACLFFRADVAIREHSLGRESLDDVLRELLLRSMKKPLDEAELVLAIDRAAGVPLAREQLQQTAPIALEPLLKKLGIIPLAKEGGPADQVRLDDNAPEASLRKQILAPAATPMFQSPAAPAPAANASPAMAIPTSRRSSSETQR